MRGSRELKRWGTCVLVLVLLYQFAPAALFSPLGKMLLAYAIIQTLFVMLGDVHQEPLDDPRDAHPPAMATTALARQPTSPGYDSSVPRG